jgi:hypothetical protein
MNCKLDMARFSLVMASILGLVLGGAGCEPAPEPPEAIWKGETFADITPPPKDRLPPPQFHVTAFFDLHVFELPTDNIDGLGAVWQLLSAAPIRLMGYNAFRENSFRLLYGKMELWEKLQSLLTEADGQHVTTVSLTVADNDSIDLPIAQIPAARPINFIGHDLSPQVANVGSGALVLRLVAEPIPWARDVRKVIGYPTYLPPSSGAIPELQAQALRGAFFFESAAWACQMGRGDFLVLGPEKYTGERNTLGGLFFNKPDESLFFNPHKQALPQRRTAVRVYVLVCTYVSDKKDL